MALTDMEVRAAKPGTRIVKLSDGGGLQLWVTPDGAKRWRLAYRFDGKQKTLAIGVYPSIGLREARDAREQARRLLADAKDPSTAKKLERIASAVASANTFDAIAAELLEKKRKEKKSEVTLEKFEWLLSLARPAIGTRPMAEITAPAVLAVLRGVESQGKLETARRLRASISQVFRFAVSTGRAEADPTSALKGAIAAPTVQHRAAIVEPRAFGGLLRSIQTYEGAPETRAALELLALLFVRPGELRAAEWGEFDLDAAVWSIPASKMKMKRPHQVPLAPKTVIILQELHSITGHGKYLFPSIRSSSRCMSENTLNATLRRLGFEKDEMSAHGFRAAASSMLNESGQWHADAIERQLAHVDSDPIRKAYARADFRDARVRMMTWWADRCDELRRGGDVITLRR